MPKDSVNRDAFTVDINKLNNFNEYIAETSRPVDIIEPGGIDFCPGDFIFTKTVAWARLSKRLPGRVAGRSRLARLGIGVHITAPKIDPGFDNRITLEVFHLGKTGYGCPTEWQSARCW